MACKPTRIHPNVAPGWGCCACKETGRADGFIYNGERRKTCKLCGHVRCDVGVIEDPFSTFAQKHPELLAVIRPADPEMALAEIDRILALQKGGVTPQDEIDRLYQEMLGLQEYTFVGLLDPKQEPGQTPRLLHSVTGEHIGDLNPGDSFVPYDALVKMFEAQQAETASS
jgi:hypothetical protein